MRDSTSIAGTDLENHIGLRAQHRDITTEDAPIVNTFWRVRRKDGMSSRNIVRYRWQEAIERVQYLKLYYEGERWTAEVDQRYRQWRLNNAFTLFGARPSLLKKLKLMAIDENLGKHMKTHQGLVRSLQFSPDGKRLATAR